MSFSRSLSSRREFLQFMGRSALSTASLPFVAAPFLSGCSHTASIANTSSATSLSELPFLPLAPNFDDKLVLAEGFQAQVLLKWGDVLNSKGEKFGSHCDFTQFIANPKSPNEALLWVNHESYEPWLVSGVVEARGNRRKSHVEREMLEVGGSILKLKRDPTTGAWNFVANSPFNRRLTAQTKIPFVSTRPIAGATYALGTVANCGGGVTPWGHILTCEENYQNFFGEVVFDADHRAQLALPSEYGWDEFHPRSPQHYGWVVEVNPQTGAAKKLTALGRFAHESATVTQASDGRCVVYSGDDKEGEHLYKFIAEKPGSLETGRLYVADTENGKWLLLQRSEQLKLQARFGDQTEVLIRCREAAKTLGATPLDRPEDIEVDPQTHDVYVTLTGDPQRKNWMGSILKLSEKGADPLALEFTTQKFMAGGESTGFACPDNLAFDPRGNLWMTCDIAPTDLYKDPYKSFGNNSLFVIPLKGSHAGRAFRVASAPTRAELTGPCFSPDGKTLFLSVQHPGEGAKSQDSLLSRWPEGGQNLPKSSVVTITGPALETLASL